jgi:DNA-binding CsgD family transcriptional regulator/GAF domain-containing protein
VAGQRNSPLAHRGEHVLSVLTRTAQLLGWEPSRVPAQLRDVHEALARLSEAWRGVLAVLSAGYPTADRLTVLVGLMEQIRAAEDTVRADQTAHHAAAAHHVRCALTTLSDVQTVAELMNLAPAVATTIGFDRVLLSRIEDLSWVPETIYGVRDADWAQQILQAGRQPLRTLDHSLLETQIARRNRPLLVTNTTNHPNLHHAMTTAARTRSYTAAPIADRGRVIGFLHADCYTQRRHLDADDRDLLWRFSDGLGHILSRTAAIEALRTLRGELQRLATPRTFSGSENGWPAGRADATLMCKPITSSPPGCSADPRPDFLGEARGALTRREAEVMDLMGAGYTNAQIAMRLVISEGTVKTHVKHVLRKMQATNRAEAVSRWLREQHPARHGRDIPHPRRMGH